MRFTLKSLSYSLSLVSSLCHFFSRVRWLNGNFRASINQREMFLFRFLSFWSESLWISQFHFCRSLCLSVISLTWNVNTETETETATMKGRGITVMRSFLPREHSGLDNTRHVSVSHSSWLTRKIESLQPSFLSNEHNNNTHKYKHTRWEQTTDRQDIY